MIKLKSISRRMVLSITAGLLLVCLLGGGCAPSQEFARCLDSIVKPYRFSIVGWEFETLLGGGEQSAPSGEVEDEPGPVTRYFSLVEWIQTLRSEIEAIKYGERQGDLPSLEAELNMREGEKAILEEGVTRILTGQIRETLAQQGIFNPVDEYTGWEVSFPPLNFRLEPPPYLLVVSPRDRIESMREITLLPSISLEEIEDIEARVDELGVSSLVVELGGFAGVYPTLVTNEASLRFTIDTATEEWLHQYLVFKPLGFRYLLDVTGVSRNYEIAIMNETLASMVSKEIGAMVCQEYYPELENDTHQHQAAESEFDFNREMREIRKAVDEYLVRGEVEPAEVFMEQKRQYLASMGYYLRRLNQAYFAFYGAYADRPTSVSPLGVELEELRSQSASLEDFLDTVAAMTSRQDLRDSIK